MNNDLQSLESFAIIEWSKRKFKFVFIKHADDISSGDLWLIYCSKQGRLQIAVAGNHRCTFIEYLHHVYFNNI